MKNFDRRISVLERDQGLMDVPASSTVRRLTEVVRISRLGAGQAAEPPPLTHSEPDWSRIPRARRLDRGSLSVGDVLKPACDLRAAHNESAGLTQREE